MRVIHCRRSFKRLLPNQIDQSCYDEHKTVKHESWFNIDFSTKWTSIQISPKLIPLIVLLATSDPKTFPVSPKHLLCWVFLINFQIRGSWKIIKLTAKNGGVRMKFLPHHWFHSIPGDENAADGMREKIKNESFPAASAVEGNHLENWVGSVINNSLPAWNNKVSIASEPRCWCWLVSMNPFALRIIINPCRRQTLLQRSRNIRRVVSPTNQSCPNHIILFIC